jgi:hypothetical protein
MLKMLGVKSTFLLFAAASVAYSVAPAAHATPIQYDFTVHVTNSNSSVLNGSTTNGSFSYDSSSILVGGKHAATGLLTGFDFTFNGISYNAATVNTGFLTFDASGVLTDFLFGTNCNAGTCTVVRSDSFFVSSTAFTFFARTPANSAGTGVTAYSLTPVSVPEPGTLGLFGLGALLLGFFAGTRRRIY